MSALPKTAAKSPMPKSGIMDIVPYVAGKSKAVGDLQEIIKLSSNESPMGPSPNALAVYAEQAKKLYRYPDSGSVGLREAIGRVHGIDPARIVCGAGSDELIGLLVHAYAGVGDEVLYSQHGFLMYKIYAQSFGATPVTAPEKNLTADVDALLAKVTPRTKLVFLANPNNPTGSYISAAEIKRLHAGLPEDVILVIDGAYAEYADKPDYTAGQELVDTTNNTVMLRTFSKMYGLSSLRVGWGYFPAAIADVLNRARGPFNVSGVGQMVAAAAIEDTAYAETIRKHNAQWLEKVSATLTKIGLKVYPSLANFILVEFPAEGKTAHVANEFLLGKGIIPREVTGYGLPQCLRITIGKAEDNEAVIEHLTAFMA